MLKRTVFAIFATTMALSGGGSARAQLAGQSLSCAAKVADIDEIVCSHAELLAEDRLMSRMYKLALSSDFGSSPSNQPAAQREWRKGLATCARAASTLTCLARLYAVRNEQLALAILFKRPDIALPELHRLDPDGAGMFEAVWRYATSAHLTKADQRRIISLLKPYELNPGGWGEASEALQNDKLFGEFVGVRLAGISRETGGRAFPCAAILRKPALIAAAGPHFGSTMDNFVVATNCQQTLPPLPKLDALVQKRIAGLTDCGGGSIRYAYYRGFFNAVSAARIATRTQLRKGAARPFPRRRGIRISDVASASAELAAYYIKNNRADAATATPLAQQMIRLMLEEAWQC